MRNLLTVILCSGVFFTQHAIASSQCTLKPGEKIHCSGCTTLEHFAFYGASALYSAGQQRSIQVTGDNGSDVYVSKGTYWERADIRIELGFLGTWGAENVPYPSLTYAKVYAHDTTNKIGGKLPNNGRMLFGALKAKCKQIKEDQEAKEKETEQTSQHYYNKYLQTDAYKGRQSFIQETNNRWQRMLDWEFILRTKYNDHRTICSPTYSGVRCDRYSRNFNGY